MIVKEEIIGGIECYHYSSEFGGKLRCIETGELFDDAYVKKSSAYSFEELENTNPISDSEALRIITGQE